ncbi:sodium ion-translocating decarboxylase subunit beta, partial [Salmonella enterica subsp. enterica serovar Cerro]|nr:sodium ion-translocating decarboxylase subunit beta [Salmonella enterica subsp. enterica serovar Cerro]
QDGQFTVDLAGDSISFRIATLPCKEGEKVVLRLLHQVEQTLDGLIAFTLPQAAAIGIIGGADGPTAIYLSGKLAPELLGAIAVA